MNREQYNDLVRGVCSDMCEDVTGGYVVDRVLKAAGVDIPELPISEQVWNVHDQYHDEHFRVHYNGKWIITVRDAQLVGAVLNLPALLAACEKIDSDADFPDSDGDCFVDGTLIAALRKALSEINK